jgi:hypothetical protein
MDKKQFFQLLKKHRQGIATPEEEQFLASYYRLLELKSGPEKELDAEEKELLKETIRRRIHERMAPAPAEKKERHLFAYVAKIAAAVIILLGACLMYYTAGHRPPAAGEGDSPVAVNRAQHPANTIAAGRNKAVLTLANGQQIMLDSILPGMLVKEGNTDIRKRDSGELVYHSIAAAGSAGLQNTITTPRGGKYKVTLSDNTEVWLNAGSSLSYPIAFHGSERRVALTGEAYFEVAPDADQPFVVTAGNTRIQVLGTHFNVNAYNDEKVIKTTLTEGAVRVFKGDESRLLKPGEQASMNKRTGMLKVRPADVEAAVAWKNGLFQFNNTQLEVIMREVSRWYDIDVVYQTKHLDGKRFSGIMSRYSEPAELLRRLELTGVVHFRLQDRQIIVMD